MRPFASYLLVTAAVIVSAAPAPARSETLAEAVALAYETNPTIQASRAQLRSLNESYVLARAGFGPRLTAQAELAYQEVRTNRAGSIQDEGAAETFSLNQPLFSSGRLTTALRAAEADVRAGRERLRQAEADLLQRVIAVYVGVRRDQQILGIVRASVEALRDRLEEVQARVDVGENTRTDLAQAQARLAGAQSDAASAEAVLASTRAQYLSIVGRNPGDLAPEPDLPPLPASIDEVFDAAEKANHLMLAAQYEEQASRSRVAEAKAQHLPSVNFRVQASRSPEAFYNANTYVNSVLAQATVSQPIFTAGVNSSNVRRQTELNTADRLTIDATRRTTVQSLAQQWSQVAAARTALVADQTNISASELAFFGMREEERFGLRSTIELLNAQLELQNAQTSFLRNRFTEYTARAAVLNLMGALTVESLAPGVSAYDAEGDFDRVKNKGALPTEWVVRAIDGVITPPAGGPRPASETTAPDLQPDLPPAPPQAAAVPPLRPVNSIVDEPPAPNPPN